MVDEEDRRDSVQSLAGLLELLRGSGDPGPAGGALVLPYSP